ncbi:PEP-CTERM sorting domain-containing protein [Ruficoccus sp. ZRK36]|uniref:PEP-CTERM sorting domain-containing protein n=1 Tax=Ruficoccus sp. ZRK36 TaxID=2866311 RepID=UPI001C73DD21|nr:PEP-CTERM sorting domain-containing protein [Ruficoccus sp. ZRK36]QYY36885.1 PEP-CTERM sorting domain-containing protein [Ruficoccus sp. ZRK36]
MRLPQRLSIRSIFAFSVGALALMGTCQAQLAWDTFDSYAADSAIGGQNGGSGWNNAWGSTVTANVTDSGISYSAGGISRGGGNALEVTTAGYTALSRNVFSEAQTGGQDYYASMIFQVNNGTSTSQSPIIGTASESAFFSWGASDSDGTATTNLTLGGVNGPTTIARVGDANRAASSGILNYYTTYFLVIRYGGWDETLGRYTTATTWLNASTTEGSGTMVEETFLGTGMGSSEIIGLKARTHFIGTDDNDTYVLFDDVVFGDSWASVTGAIPEPSTYAALGGLAVLGVVILRRRLKA